VVELRLVLYRIYAKIDTQEKYIVLCNVGITVCCNTTHDYFGI